MYGLNGILGNFVTSVASPAVGGIVGDIAGQAVEDELAKQITQTTVGTLSGAALGAGIGALTGGGGSGALSGAITGGVGGGVGGYNAQDISQMFGMGQGTPQGVGAPVPSQPPANEPSITDQLWAQKVQGLPTSGGAGPSSNLEDLSRQAVSPRGIGLDYTGSPAALKYGDVQKPVTVPSTAPAPAPSEYKGYIDFLKKNYEPLAGGFYLGSAYGATKDTQAQGKKYQQDQLLAQLIEDQKARDFANSVYYPGYADGGAVNVGLPATGVTPQVEIHIPAWAQEDMQRSGGLAALQPGIRQGMATGGYVNTQPFDPQEFYPQSRIASAQPYAAAAGTRVLDTIHSGASFAHGGLIDGPGDGMSDSIPANISGREPVKVADGEYVIPRSIAEKYGPDKLQAMMSKVRASAHAKKGKQIVQGAAQRALIQSLSGVKA